MQHGLDDLAVAGAAAQHTAQRIAHLFLGRRGVLFEQRRGRNQEARRADAALRGAMLEEGGLQRRQFAVGEAFDGAHRAARNAGYGNQAGADRLAVEQDGAGAAVAGVAADLGAGQAELVAQHRGQPP